MSERQVVYFDIETTGLEADKNEMTAIQYWYRDADKPIVHINAAVVKDKFVRDDVEVVYFDSEVDLLTAFKGMTDNRIVAGWYTSGGMYVGGTFSYHFDIKFLVERAKALGINPNFVVETQNKRYDKFYDVLNFEPVDLNVAYNNVIDTKIKMIGLDTIAIIENLSVKKSKTAAFSTWHIDNPQEWFDYAVRDVVILKELDMKRDIIDIMKDMAHEGDCRIRESLTKTTVWSNRMAKGYRDNGILCHKDKKDNHNPAKFGGGLSVDPPCLYKTIDGVAVFDINSLYPSIMQAANLSYETQLEPANIKQVYHFNGAEISAEEVAKRVAAKKDDGITVKYVGTDEEADKIISGVKGESTEDRIVTFCGAVYKGDVNGMLPLSLDDLFTKRKEYKAIMKEELFGDEHDNADIKQKAVKVLMNSAYGVQGVDKFTFRRPSIRTAITSTAHVVLTAIRKTIEAKEYQVIYGDTDSIFVKCQQHEIANIQTIIDGVLLKVKEYYSFKKDLVMEYDKYCKNILFTANKSYSFENDKGEFGNIGGIFAGSKSSELVIDWYKKHGRDFCFYDRDYAKEKLRQSIESSKLSQLCHMIGKSNKTYEKQIDASLKFISERYGIQFGDYYKVMKTYALVDINGKNELLIPYDFTDRDELFADIIDDDCRKANVLKQLNVVFEKKD